jgi:hypothetical protein
MQTEMITKTMAGTQTPIIKTVTLKRIASGYYTCSFEVVLKRDGSRDIKTAHAQIVRREDGSGWGYTLCVHYAGGAVSELSSMEDVYEQKRHIVEFFNSPRSRRWEYVTEGGLNSWCLG